MRNVFKFLVWAVVIVITAAALTFYFGFYRTDKIDHFVDEGCKSFSMVATEQSKKDISEIVNTLADTSTVGLAFKSGHLKQLGKNVDTNVPSPLAFLAIIFSDSHLANQMKVIRQSSFKYNNFIEGLYPNMMKLYVNKNCFKKTMDSFSDHLRLNKLRTFTIAETCGKHGEDGDKDAFKPFVDFLIDQKAL
jgi:hypothetical protein